MKKKYILKMGFHQLKIFFSQLVLLRAILSLVLTARSSSSASDPDSVVPTIYLSDAMVGDDDDDGPGGDGDEVTDGDGDLVGVVDLGADECTP